MKKGVFQILMIHTMILFLAAPAVCKAAEEKIRSDATGHYYQVYKTKKTWSDARFSCEKAGGYLVTVTSAAERDFLVKRFFAGSRQSFWAGATDSETEGQWKWLTGEPFAFADWRKGEPNDEKGEDCLELPVYFDYQWNDVPDAAKRNCYVCEWGETVIETDADEEAAPDNELAILDASKTGTTSETETEPSIPAASETPSSTETETDSSSIAADQDEPEVFSNQSESSGSETYTYYVPLFEYSSQFLTGLGLSNSSEEGEAAVVVEVLDPSGGEIMTQTVVIAPDGQQTVVLYPDKSARGWLNILSDRPLTGVCFMVATGSGCDNFMADIPISGKTHQRLHVPHVSYDSDWETTLFVANPNDAPQAVHIDVVASDGQVLASDTAQISARGCGQYGLSALLARQHLVGGKVKLHGPEGIVAFALYTNLKTGARSFAGISPMEPF